MRTAHSLFVWSPSFSIWPRTLLDSFFWEPVRALPSKRKTSSFTSNWLSTWNVRSNRDGAVLIDAPVSGAVPRAKTGTLAIMIGGNDKAAIERAKPLLLAMGKQLFETGPLGTGHAMKALNNYIAAAGYTAVAEALLIGERFGLNQETMVDILNASTGRNFTTEVMVKEHVLGGKFATGFAVGLMAKDVKIAADLGEAVKLDAPLSRLIRERWAIARDRLGAAADTSAAILSWKDNLPE